VHRLMDKVSHRPREGIDGWNFDLNEYKPSITQLAQLEASAELEAGNFGDWLREHVLPSPYRYILNHADQEHENDLTQLAQLGSAA